MSKYILISDKDDVYKSFISKLKDDPDYISHQILLDINSKQLQKIKGLKEEELDDALFVVLSSDASKVIIKLLKMKKIGFEQIFTVKDVEELSKTKERIDKIYNNAAVCYTLSEEAEENLIKMDEVNYDYIRFRTLSLVINQIKTHNIKGNLAEVGVFQGDFSRWLNYCLEDRELYLFDTFEGFDECDCFEEKQGEHCLTKELNDILDDGFKNTSVEYVLDRMKFRDKCKVYKGYFPETAENIDDTFCFVSLDTDLYRPTKEGLLFFYPKLVQGGYIFIHDCNSPICRGVHQAVDEWCKENNVVPVPMCDKYGSVIIVKQ